MICNTRGISEILVIAQKSLKSVRLHKRNFSSILLEPSKVLRFSSERNIYVLLRLQVSETLSNFMNFTYKGLVSEVIQ